MNMCLPKPNWAGEYPCQTCFRLFLSPTGYFSHLCSKKNIRRNELTKWPFSAVFSKVCLKSGMTFFARSHGIKYHPNAVLDLRTYRARSSFKFNVYDHPDLFDLELIKRHGWYSPGGRNGKNKSVNMKGVSRDHLYPVKLGWLNNIDPLLLSHPMNCQILIHTDNISKRDKPAITIEELKKRVADF